MELFDRDCIVFAGDSTTDADKLTSPDLLGHGYVRLVRDALAAFRPEKFRVVNAGISGNTSAQLLERWERDVAAEKPDVLFCMIGINDVWRHFDSLDPALHLIPKEEYARNVDALCKRAKGVREVRFMTPYYVERSHADEMRKMTEEYAAVMREAAADNGIKVIDLQAEFDAYLKYRSGQTIGWDRVHPGPIGSMIIARAVMRELQSEFLV